ncbi:MAG: 50S ribosomal protein L9 [Flavobacteriaceae bacterium]|jgi:large subunit ribosomal protein L9|nr:50S ribosomal protein L9 [Flavobacteriaceae bacterium]
MELILKIDVEGVGFKDDIVKVKNGFGRNYLIPNGSAILATSSAKKVLAENLKQRAFKEKKIIDDATKLSKKISALDLKIKSKVGQGVKLFGSINNIDLQKSLETNGFEIDKKQIMIPGSSIKQLGKYTASVRLHREVISDLAFEIIPENK